MHILLFFAGLCLGSVCGFLLALLLLHARAQSIAEEMVSSRRTAEIDGGEPAWGPSDEWMYARRSTAANGLAE